MVSRAIPCMICILALTVFSGQKFALASSQVHPYGDPGNSGLFDVDGPERPEKVAWGFHVPGEITGPPVMSGGAIYMGSSTGDVFAVDVNSHQKRWRFRTGQSILGSPALGENSVLVASVNRHIYAIDAASGELRWRVKTSQTVDNGLAFHNGHVSYTDNKAGIWSLVGKTGDMSWSYKGPVILGVESKAKGNIPSRFSLPAYDSNNLYSTSFASTGYNTQDYRNERYSFAYAFDPGDGAVLWRRSPGLFDVKVPPVAAGGDLFIAGLDGRVYSLSPGDGKRLWRTVCGSGVKSMASAGGVLFVLLKDGHLLALDTASGGELWSFFAGGPSTSTLSLSRQHAYFGNAAGLLVAVDRETGMSAWEYDAARKILFISVLDDRQVLFVAEGGDILVLGGGKGQVLAGIRP